MALERKLDEVIAGMENIVDGLVQVKEVRAADNKDDTEKVKEVMDRSFDSTVQKLRLAVSMSGKCGEAEIIGQVLQRTMDILHLKQDDVKVSLQQKDEIEKQPPTLPCITSNPDLEMHIKSTILSTDLRVVWDSIKGHEEAKEALRQAVILPKKYPQLFTGNREPWKSILLYGPPGTGKTQLAKAVASECGSTFFSVSSSDLISKWMGESEKLVKVLFEMAKCTKPSIIFLDEIDALCSMRGGGDSDVVRRVKTEFLVQMNNLENDVFVLAVTNLPWDIDSAMLRRFEQRLYIPLPTEGARRQIVDSFLAASKNTTTEEEVENIVQSTKGFSGSDITQMLKKANMLPVQEYLSTTPQNPIVPPPLEYRHIANILSTTKSTITSSMIDRYNAY